jgi:hypothetical protein
MRSDRGVQPPNEFKVEYSSLRATIYDSTRMVRTWIIRFEPDCSMNITFKD